MARLADYTLTSAEAAERLGLNPKTFTRWATDEKVPHVRTPGGWRKYRPEDIDEFEKRLVTRHNGDAA